MATKPIPKKIHQINGNQLSPLIDKCVKSWQVLIQEGFEIITWNDTELVTFIKNQHHFAYEAFMNSRNHAEAADIARYLIIYTYGGYYVDWDIELLDPQGFLTLNSEFPKGYMLCDSSNNTLASEYFCALSGDRFLLNLTKDIVELFENGLMKFYLTPQYSGPFRMRDSLIRHPKTDMSLVPLKKAFAYGYDEIRYMKKKEIKQPMLHYWAHSWRTLS